MNEPKPGKQTTELWIGVVPLLISLLTVYGLVSKEQAMVWQELLVGMIPLAVWLLSYPLSRGIAKKQ